MSAMGAGGGVAAPRPSGGGTRTTRAATRQARRLLPPLLARFGRLLRLWRRRMAEADELAALSPRELRDMDANRYEATHEARRPFWRPP